MKTRYSAIQILWNLNKVVVLLALFFLATFQSNAQKKSQSDHSRITSAAYLENILNDRSSTNYIVTSESRSTKSGIKHTYVQQVINGIEVQGTESSLHVDANGKTIMAHVNFVDDITSSVAGASASITAEQAITAIAQQMGYQLTNLQIKEHQEGVNQKGLFNNGGISKADIPVRLLYYYRDGIGTRLVWEIQIVEKETPNWWNFRVDANSGIIIDKNNWTASCNIMGDHSEEGHKAMAEAKKLQEEATKVGPHINTLSESSAVPLSYEVFAWPKESPYSGPRTVEIDPADPAASSLGWHSDGVMTYDYTKGNNVAAYDDGSDDDTAILADFTPESAPGLEFLYPFDLTEPGGDPIYGPMPSEQSQDAAVVNLFYWNNITHDIMYHYGFTEDSGNFQEDNGVFGGIGSDSVNAEAQDSADLAPTAFNRCNANFGTPPDGGNPRMQMYICDGGPTPLFNDGDFDAVVIIHEYGHGISNRLVGGPADANALNNAEQMGEGWSDFYGLLLTMDATNFMDDRVVGNFLFDEGPMGPGIRPAPYSIDTMVNGFTYDDVSDPGVSEPHGIGFIWATILYDMTQALIADYGFDPDVYTGTGGNNIALLLVTEAMKLQEVFPGFVSGRDAILAADFALSGGLNECLIWSAFAGRGVGFSADQGSPFDRFDGIEAFDMPIATFTPSRASLCITEGTVAGLSGGRLVGGVYSDLGGFVTDAGDGMTFSFDTVAAGLGMHTVTYDDPCTGTMASTIITVTDGTPIVICKDVTITLDGAGDATIIADQVISNMNPGDGSLGYLVDETGAFAPVAIATPAVPLGDDAGTGPLPIGFDFDFFGTTFTSFFIASNGFVSFTGAGMAGLPSYTPTTIPTAASPDGMIALVWDDLSPNISGTINYSTIGVAPDRTLIVNFDAVPLFGAPETVTVQLQLYEGSNVVEIHTTLAENDGGVRTQGIENVAGTEGFTSTGRDLTAWVTAADYVAFRPISSGMPDNCASPVTIDLSQSAFTCADIGDNEITVTIDDGMGGIATCMATVTVVGPTSTYAAGSWDIVPDAGRKALFDDSYNTSAGDITACSCEIAMSSTVTVDADGFLDITGNIKVDSGSTLIIEHEGSVRQTNNDAIVTNDGTISILKTTPTMAAQSFMVIGSPMTAETREGVYATSYIAREHSTLDFSPHPDVTTMFPMADNFADDDGNNWTSHTGLLSPAEGYLVFPQPDGTASGIFTHDYTTGTLNNGVITFPVVFNGSQIASPNILSNPYASAIDADLFFADPANAAIDVLYFWDHLTAASVGYPGYSAANFSMGDISLWSDGMMGGVGMAAPNGVDVPTKDIASGQGFGIKAASAGITATFNNAMRITGPNDTYRSSGHVERDLIWLNVVNDTYGLGGNTVIGFSEFTTDEYDHGTEVTRLATPVSLYSELVTGEQLAINALASFEVEDQVNLSFVTMVEELQSYRISVQEIEGTNIENETIYIIDNQLNVITNLSDGDYTFESNAGTFSNRFTVVFENSVLGIDDSNLDAITLYPNPTQNILHIVSPQTVVTAVTVYDIGGRKVSEADFRNKTNYQIDLSTLEMAVYFIEIVTDYGTITKRVIKK